MKRIILLILCAMFLLTSCKSSAIEKVEQYIYLDLSSAEVISEYETHGGFHGDGITFIKLQCDSDIAAMMVTSSKQFYRSLPLTDSLSIMLYGSDERSALSDAEGNPLFPEVENGSYYFLDLHPDASGEVFDDDELLGRGSYNFVVAIFDFDTCILYYCKYDT